MAEIITTRPLFAVPNAKELVEEKEPVNEYFGLFKSNDGGRCLHITNTSKEAQPTILRVAKAIWPCGP